MQQNLLAVIQEKYLDYHDQIIKHLEEFDYRLNRYGIAYSLALFAADSIFDKQMLPNMVRKTDKIIFLEENLFVVIFDFTTQELGMKAAENLLAKIEPQMFAKKLFVSVVHVSDLPTVDDNLRKLFDTLRYEIKNNINDVPLV